MKRAITLGIGALALAGMTLPTSAADLGARPITKAPVAAPIPLYDWSGFYIGAHIGGAWENSDWNLAVPAGFGGVGGLVFPAGTTAVALAARDRSSFIAGGQAGFNF